MHVHVCIYMYVHVMCMCVCLCLYACVYVYMCVVEGRYGLNLVSLLSLPSSRGSFYRVLSLSCNSPTQSQEEHLEALGD